MLIPTGPKFLKQKNMVRVLYALAPVALSAVYFFGWRVAALLAVSAVCCFATEWSMTSRRGGKVSYACFVTAALYALSLPPTVPFWIAGVGAVIAILFAKEAFGGFGKNVFNPAIVGRAFVYVCFPIELTSRFVPALRKFPAGFAAWDLSSAGHLPSHLARGALKVADAITAATPMWSRRDFGHVTGLWDLASGAISGVFQFEGADRVLAAGSSGEVSTIAIALSAIYLLATKTAQWRLVVSTLVGAIAINVLLRSVAGIDAVPPVGFALLSGGLAYAAAFMVTDPVSAPKSPLSQWIYGTFIGAMIVFFRYKAIFAGGVAFSILLGNALAPSLDLWIKRATSRKATAEAQ